MYALPMNLYTKDEAVEEFKRVRPNATVVGEVVKA
jgi:hypothetical protein